MTTPHVPPPIGGIFGLKNVSEFQDDPLHFLMHLAHNYDDIIHFKFGPINEVYLVTHPDYIHEILVKQWKHTIKWERMRRSGELFAPHNLVILEGEMWRQARKLTAPAFHTQRIKEYINLMVTHTKTLMDTWQDGDVYDMNGAMTSVTMGVIGEILFDIDDIERDASQLAESLLVILDNFMAEVTAIIPMPEWVPTKRNIDQHRAIAFAQEYIMKIIRERRESGEDRGDVLSALMLAVDEDNGRTLTDDQVRDLLLSMFTAGYETTSRALTWALYELAKNPNIQERLFEEVSTVMQGEVPTLDDLEAMHFTDQIMQETMRMYPSAWVLFTRRVLDPIQLGDNLIPEGAIVMISPYVVHHDPRWWENPDKFDPDRFTGEWKKRIPNYAYMPFGGGPRVCIGSHMAEMEEEVILSALVKRFKFELTSPDQEVSPEAQFTLTPMTGKLPLRVTLRQ